MGTYSTSTGERYTTAQLDSKIREAKSLKISEFIDEYGYVFCEECGRNVSNTYIDCSHDISVKKAKENGQAEQCYNVKNIKLLCRRCHLVKDLLYLGGK